MEVVEERISLRSSSNAGRYNAVSFSCKWVEIWEVFFVFQCFYTLTHRSKNQSINKSKYLHSISPPSSPGPLATVCLPLTEREWRKGITLSVLNIQNHTNVTEHFFCHYCIWPKRGEGWLTFGVYNVVMAVIMFLYVWCPPQTNASTPYIANYPTIATATYLLVVQYIVPLFWILVVELSTHRVK